MSITTWRNRRNLREYQDEAEVERINRAWIAACEGAALVRTVDTVTGPTVIAPKIAHVVLGPPTVLTVKLQPGMVAADVTTLGRRLAPHLGCYGIRVVPRGIGDWVEVTLLGSDPLAVTVPLAEPVVSVQESLCLGLGENGQPVTLNLADAAHLIVQGSTGAGKSIGCYSLLGQLAAAPDVQVTGSDVSGLLLGPWARRPDHGGRHALGTGDPAAHPALLEELVAAMDKAITGIRPGRDSVNLDEHPVTVVVVEELPGLLRWLDAADKTLAKRARTALARLLAEGRKAGFRVLLVTQRADAAIVGAYERSQASHRLSFRVDTADGLKMLHPDIDMDTAAEHSSAGPGIALLSAPGASLTRLRAPHMTYADYVRTVEQQA
ncbi:MAG: hypothetical protein L0I76_20155 [Pseudonocardia sp.]|nr:hypothetical protein [Pseudonocardia sp.]